MTRPGDGWDIAMGTYGEEEQPLPHKEMGHLPTKDLVVYAVWRNSDRTEGRGPMVIEDVFLNKQAAENCAVCTGGVMSYDHGGEVKELVIKSGDPFAIRAQVIKDKDNANREELRRQALDKLTPYEQELLGLKE